MALLIFLLLCFIIVVKQLVLLGFLIVSILFIYAVLSFAIMSSFFDPSQDLYCTTLWHCYVTVIRVGLLDGLGVSLLLLLVCIFRFIVSVASMAHDYNCIFSPCLSHIPDKMVKTLAFSFGDQLSTFHSLLLYQQFLLK